MRLSSVFEEKNVSPDRETDLIFPVRKTERQINIHITLNKNIAKERERGNLFRQKGSHPLQKPFRGKGR